MNIKSRLLILGMLLPLTFTFAFAQGVPISVYPDPADFGTVAENSTSYPLVLYLTNTTVDPVTVTGMSISGADSNDFAFDGPTCVGAIPGNQTCQMAMTFSPLTTGSLSANLLISVQGLQQPITEPLLGTGGNPIPTITSLSPPSAYVNSPGFTLTVNGTNFISGAVVFWENTALPTTYVSATQLRAQVPASDLTQTSQIYVYVDNPSPGGGYSPSVNFSVVALDPSISYLAPASLVAGAKSTSIVVNGSNFMTGAKVLWNGSALPTTYVTSTQLQIQPTAGELATANIVQLAVSNPAPGGLSGAVIFDVTYPAKVTILDLPANDLVWDPYAQRIYASVPSSYGSNGNTIAVINPSKGTVTGYFFAGSEPNHLALSSDAQYAYVSLNGNGSVERLILPNFTQDIEVGLGTSQSGGLNTALSLQVSPGDSHTFAVAMGANGCCGSELAFYKDSTRLPDVVTNPYIDDIVFPSSTTLYGYSNGSLSLINVNSNGGTLGTTWNGLIQGNAIRYDAGLIYGGAGEVFDPATGLLLGTYDVSNGCCAITQILPDSAIDRTFVLGQTPFFAGGLSVTSYNLEQFTPVAVTELSQLSGNTTPAFIQWGSSGLAFVLQSGCCGNTTNQVVLVQSPTMLLTLGKTKNPVPVAQSLSPASATHGGRNFPVTIQGTGFVPGSQVTWNGTALDVAYVNSTELTIYVPAGDIASAGTASVVVKNPLPGGGTAAALAFTIN